MYRASLRAYSGFTSWTGTMVIKPLRVQRYNKKMTYANKSDVFWKINE